MWYKKVFKCRQLVSKIMKIESKKKEAENRKNERDDGKVTVKE